MSTATDPRDLFADASWADAHPETYDRKDRRVPADSVAEGLDNAGGTEKRKAATLRYLRRGKR